MVLHCPVYGIDFVIFHGKKGRKNLLRELKKQKMSRKWLQSEDAKGCAGYCNGSVFWVRNPRRLGDWIHEAHHAVRDTLEYLHIQDEEAAAYLQGWLVRAILSRLRKKHRFPGKTKKLLL